MAKQKIHSTTQAFTEISNIENDTVYFKNGNACAIIEVSSVNFYLLSKEEQEARIYGYMSLLNSLSFSIQILIVSKKVDITLYLKLLDQKITSAKNIRIADHLKLYKEFIQELIVGEDLLDKKVYIVVPFSPLELGAASSAHLAAKGSQKLTSAQKTHEIIVGKANHIILELERTGLYAKIVSTDELIKLFYVSFNQEALSLEFKPDDIKNIVLTK